MNQCQPPYIAGVSTKGGINLTIVAVLLLCLQEQFIDFLRGQISSQGIATMIVPAMTDQGRGRSQGREALFPERLLVLQ